MHDADLDIALYGATGFTGRLTAEYLLRTYGVAGELRWALAGRDRAKLERTREELSRETGVDASPLPILTGDSGDATAMEALARSARVVCTTVGPYARYGSELVAACARAGTHYCDLTGEIHWMRRMIDAHEEAARRSGARIVFACGFDCIPSDVGTFFVQREMRSRHGVASPRVHFRVVGFRGGASGGTIASMMNILEEAGRDPEVMRVMRAPYGLNPKGQQAGPDPAEGLRPVWDPHFRQWTAPFLMAAADTKVVRRTNALLGFPYGQGFRYDEAVLTGAGPAGLAKALAVSAGIGGAMLLGAVGPLRRLVARRLPAPGEGPDRETREKGYFDVRLLAEHPEDPAHHVFARVRGDRDPGYGSTSKMLGESAVCLARDDLEVGGGCWTPAAALGEQLLARLPARAGVRFDLE